MAGASWSGTGGPGTPPSVGVGMFPLTHPAPHTLFALAATALGVLFLEWAPVAALGEGGIERWIVYPVVLWLVAFGSYLLAAAAGQRAG